MDTLSADHVVPSPARSLAGRGTPEGRWRAWQGLCDAPEISLDSLVPQGRRAVVVAPHPDDEVLGCGGLLALLAGQRRDLLVIGVTDGEASHAGCEGWRPDVLARRRRAERELGLACLGQVPSVDLRLADGGVTAQAEALARRLLVRLRASDIVFVTSHIDGHPDHEACASAAALAARTVRCRVVEVPVWLWHWAEPADPGIAWHTLRRLPLTDDAQRRKAAAIQAHSSQLASLYGREAIVASWALERLLRPFECFFLKDVLDA